jgi:hypothetical protein
VTLDHLDREVFSHLFCAYIGLARETQLLGFRISCPGIKLDPLCSYCAHRDTINHWHTMASRERAHDRLL